MAPTQPVGRLELGFISTPKGFGVFSNLRTSQSGVRVNPAQWRAGIGFTPTQSQGQLWFNPNLEPGVGVRVCSPNPNLRLRLGITPNLRFGPLDRTPGLQWIQPQPPTPNPPLRGVLTHLAMAAFAKLVTSRVRCA